MSRPPFFLALGGALLVAVAVVVATVVTVSGQREDSRCSDPAYGCAEFLPGEAVRIGLLGREPETRRGVELAIAGHGSVAGRSIQLLVEADGCSVTGAAAAARELASDPAFEPPVIAVVDAGCAEGLQAATQILSDSGISLITTQAVPVAFEDPQRSFLVRAPVGEPSQDFRRRYEARYGSEPAGIHAWLGYRFTLRVLAGIERLVVRSSDGRLLVPKTALHGALTRW